MKTLEDARHLRNHILGAFELAELTTDPAERAKDLTFVVVGAGPTGVEVVGQIAELAHRVLPDDYRAIDTSKARIVLVEAAPAVLGPFDSATRKSGSTGWASKSVAAQWRSRWTTTVLRSRAAMVRNAYPPERRYGRPGCRHRRWPEC
jgi:NADH dehydrogenase FAD-containing subunit